MITWFLFRLKEDQGKISFKEKLGRKMVLQNILDNLELKEFLENIMKWLQGKNMFIEEDCMILNFGLVVIFSRSNILLMRQV